MIRVGFHLPFQVRAVQLHWSLLELRHGPSPQIWRRLAKHQPTKMRNGVFPSGKLLSDIRVSTRFLPFSFFGALVTERLNHMQSRVISKGLPSNTTAFTASNVTANNRARINRNFCQIGRSELLLRAAIASMIATLILVPGGFRALQNTGIGWETWSYSRILMLSMMILHFAACWMPLARRYFRRGECADVPAFLIASACLFLQILISYAVFNVYSIWHG